METEGEPTVIRRAKALKKILENIIIGIDDGELIVGKAVSKLVSSPLFPEFDWRYLEQLVNSNFLSVEEKEKLEEIIPYWKGKSFCDFAPSRIPEEYRDVAGILCAANVEQQRMPFAVTNLAHMCPGYDKVIIKGLNSIMRQAEEEKYKLDLSKVENLEKYTFLQAVKIALQALSIFAKRYAELAKNLAAKEVDLQKKAELEMTANACEWISENPARTFQEALQSIWLTYIALVMEGLGPAIGFGRMDQYLYPFYKRDVEEGRLTKEQARELLELFLIKMNELLFHFPGSDPFTIKWGVRAGAENPLSTITIGGIKRDGSDATNELSYLFLEAEMNVGLLEDIAVRVHPNTPYQFLMKACEVAKVLAGKLKFVGDETAIKQMLKDGKSLEDARDYVICGCFIHTVPGCSTDPPMAGGSFPNLPLALELALNNGVHRMTGKQIGPKTGNPKEFKSYDELWKAFKKQLDWLMHVYVVVANSIMPLYNELTPYPLMSALFDGCIEKGMDITRCGAIYNTGSFWFVGIVNVGDSLAAVKKVVFEDKKVMMDTLIDALDKNFEGYEEVYCHLRSAPKFGNDDDYADSIVNDVLVQLCEEAKKYTSFAGRKITIDAGNVVGHIPCGRVVGATPEGRRAGEPFSDGGISPYYGRNVNGVTSTLRSVAKLDLWRTSGSVLNVKFNPNDLKEEFKIESRIRKFASLIKTFARIGGDIVQFSFVNSDMLRDAQKHPEKYKDLLVRVATYSAYFVDLPREIQDDIIRRTEMGGSY
jgi:formate C-acetyltransferase